MAERTTEIAARERQAVSRREPLRAASPFRMLERFADEMDNLFEDFGLGRSWLGPRFGRQWLSPSSRMRMDLWAPEIEVTQQASELVIRADLPGMNREDVCVDVTDTDISISGDRRQEEEVERGGVYRSERSYGSFCRTIPLPEGTMADQAKATFKDGVLEIRIPAPPQATRGRRLEIKEAADAKK
jgi:HSP20 family protein